MPSSASAADDAEGGRWLLLIHQIPAKPAYVRVKLWRRLQALGAVAVKNAVYALPASEEASEDFAWLMREIVAGGGEAIVCEARFVDGLTDGAVRDLFNAARDTDYQALAEEVRALGAAVAAGGDAADAKAQLVKLRARQSQIAAIDFFGANSREAAEGLLSALEWQLRGEEEPMAARNAAKPGVKQLAGKVWVTRSGVHVDRIACAWLVRRFIDPGAAFKFVARKDYTPKPGEIRFDMFEAEITHEGDRCSFEVLIERAALTKDRALAAIAEIVHDIDLKDAKFGRAEAPGIAQLLSGVAATSKGDDERIARGATIFDDLYGGFRQTRSRR